MKKEVFHNSDDLRFHMYTTPQTSLLWYCIILGFLKASILQNQFRVQVRYSII